MITLKNDTPSPTQLSINQSHPLATVRPIRPSDIGLIYQMHQRLTPESLYYRYLQTRIPSQDEIAQVCQLDPERGAGFVAIPNKGRGRIVGVAYYLREPLARHATAEPSILVEDRYQGVGIGRSLWQRLHEDANLHQIRWLRVLFHPSNQRMWYLLKNSGFPYQASSNEGRNEFMVALGEQSQPSALQRLIENLRFSFGRRHGGGMEAAMPTSLATELDMSHFQLVHTVNR